VWGCRFKGGAMGVFAMEGAPYVYGNLFEGCERGIRYMMGDGADPAIVRSNTFVGCSVAGLEVASRQEPIFGPSVRNNIFERCGAAVLAGAKLQKRVTHNLAHACGEKPFRTAEGEGVETASALSEDPALSIGADGAITVGKPEPLKGKGIGQTKDSAADIGPDAQWTHPGPIAGAPLPPVRFRDPKIANSVSEEYQYLSVLGARMSSQSLQHVKGVPTDVLTLGDGSKVSFDLSRFFNERGL
jgi:hypothetical protein